MKHEEFVSSINMAYERFKLNMLNTSKINIYSKAEEIYHKKRVVDVIKDNTSDLSSNVLEYLAYAIDSIIDEVYELMVTKENIFNNENIINVLNHIISNGNI